MVWPAAPESLADIPMGTEDRVMLQVTDPDVADALCKFVAGNAHSLEAITEGDETKEVALGGLFAKLAYAAAGAHKHDMRGMPTL